MIKAHTLQREGVLRQLLDAKKQVLTVSLADASVITRGWKQASIFQGLCGKHDNELFAPIERQPFDGQPEQTFLVGYRSLCHELYQKAAGVRGLGAILPDVDRGHDPEAQRGSQFLMQTHRASVALGERDNRMWKDVADSTLASGNFDEWGSCVFEIDGDLAVASAGSMTPSFDASGQRLQFLENVEKPLEPVMYGVIADPAASRNWVVMTWPPGCEISGRFVRSLVTLEPEQRGDALVRMMFAHVENTFFSRDWWNALGSERQQEVFRLAAIFDPQLERGILRQPPLVEWRVVAIDFRDAGRI